MSPGQILAAIQAAQTIVELISRLATISQRDHAWTPEERREFGERMDKLRATWAAMPDFVEGDDDPLRLQ